MEKRTLGQSGIEVSRLTVGCWAYGGDAKSYWGAQDQADVNALVAEALERGINFFDTAFAYNDGKSEESLGLALGDGLRGKAVICNKIPIQPWDAMDKYKQTVRDSLRRLQTDHVDILMIHWPTADEALLRANLEALDSMRRKGLAKAIGVSNFGPATMAICGEMGIPVAVNELVYNLVSRGIEQAILPDCLRRGIGIAAYMPLMQGLLTGRYHSAAEMPPSRTRSYHFNSATSPQARHGGSGAEAEVFAAVDTLRALARENNTTPGDLAIAWVLARPGITTAIAGCRTVQQLRENAAAAEMTLDPALVAALDAAGEPIRARLGDVLDMWAPADESRVW